MTSSDRANLEEIATPAKTNNHDEEASIIHKRRIYTIRFNDALQERAFRQPGFRFGWFMTLIEIVVVSTCAFMFEWARADPTVVSGRHATIRMCVGGLGLCLATSQGTGSAALNYVHYPVKVPPRVRSPCHHDIWYPTHKENLSILEYGRHCSCAAH